jgi:hypothetical protein
VPYIALKIQESPTKARILAVKGANSRLVFLRFNVLICRQKLATAGNKDMEILGSHQTLEA